MSANESNLDEHENDPQSPASEMATPTESATTSPAPIAAEPSTEPGAPTVSTERGDTRSQARNLGLAAMGTVTGISVAGEGARDRQTAAGMALLGAVGTHHFYLGDYVKGALFLLFSWTGIPALLGFRDAFRLFRMSDDEFNQKWGVEQAPILPASGECTSAGSAASEKAPLSARSIAMIPLGFLAGLVMFVVAGWPLDLIHGLIWSVPDGFSEMPKHAQAEFRYAQPVAAQVFSLFDMAICTFSAAWTAAWISRMRLVGIVLGSFVAAFAVLPMVVAILFVPIYYWLFVIPLQPIAVKMGSRMGSEASQAAATIP